MGIVAVNFFLLLFLAPLMRGGNRPIALLVLEILGLCLILSMTLSSRFRLQLSHTQMSLIGLLLAYPLLQLIPIPFEFWQALPGRELYADAMRMAGLPLHQIALPISIAPENTWQSFLALIPPVAAFVYMMSCSDDKMQNVVGFLIVIALLQATLGLMQYANGPDSLLRLGWYHAGISAAGTYANRDHLAGLLEMILPLSLALFVSTIPYQSKVVNSKRNFIARILDGSLSRISRFTIFAISSILILLGLIFTQSRSGIALGMLSIFISAIVFSYKLKNSRQTSLLFSIFIVGIMFAIEIGLVPILNRFAYEDPLKDLRWIFFGDTIHALVTFFPFGSGFGTFSQVYERFQSAEIIGVFVNHAHNDYLEWVMEGGIAVVIFIASLMLLYLMQMKKLFQCKPWYKKEYIQIGAGIGILMMAFHSLVDFNLHIPANQIFFASLLGLYFRKIEQV